MAGIRFNKHAAICFPDDGCCSSQGQQPKAMTLEPSKAKLIYCGEPQEDEQHHI